MMEGVPDLESGSLQADDAPAVEAIGDLLKAARLRNGLTLRELAAADFHLGIVSDFDDTIGLALAEHGFCQEGPGPLPSVDGISPSIASKSITPVESAAVGPIQLISGGSATKA